MAPRTALLGLSCALAGSQTRHQSASMLGDSEGKLLLLLLKGMARGPHTAL